MLTQLGGSPWVRERLVSEPPRPRQPPFIRTSLSLSPEENILYLRKGGAPWLREQLQKELLWLKRQTPDTTSDSSSNDSSKPNNVSRTIHLLR